MLIFNFKCLIVNMKNKFLTLSISLVAGSAIAISSCKPDFLEVTPIGVYSENQLQNKIGVNGMLISTYSTVAGPDDT